MAESMNVTGNASGGMEAGNLHVNPPIETSGEFVNAPHLPESLSLETQTGDQAERQPAPQQAGQASGQSVSQTIRQKYDQTLGKTDRQSIASFASQINTSASALISKTGEQLRSAGTRIKTGTDVSRRAVTDTAQRVDRSARENPWMHIGLVGAGAFALGLLAGKLIMGSTKTQPAETYDFDLATDE